MANFAQQFGNNNQANDENLGYEFRFDGDELEQAGRPSLYRAIPEGEYDFTVDDLQFRQSKNGNDYVMVTLSIERPDGEVRVSDNLVCTVKGKWKIAAYMAAIGQWENVKKMGLTQDFWTMTVGNVGRCKIKNEEYNGKIKNRVESYINQTPGVAAVR